MENYVFDTNLFFNMEAGFDLGQKTEMVVRNLTQIIIELRKTHRAEFFTSPRVVEEFLSFFPNKNQTFIKNFISAVTVKSPQVDKINLPARTFYHLIREMRERNRQAMKIGNEQLKKLGEMVFREKVNTKRELMEKSGPIIKNYRQRIRNATRTGFIDSLADFDLILLAKELDAYLVTADEGVRRWGRIFGTKEVLAKTLSARLNLLRHQGQS